MLSGRQSGTELVERILAEIGLAAPEIAVRAAAREQLRKRIGKLLNEDGYSTAPPERRTVTILQTEIRGIGELAESRPATVVVNLLNRFLVLATEIVARHDGTIDRLTGDTVTVLFGAAAPEDRHVERALACAAEMQQVMSRCNQQNEALQLPPLYLGIGINSGEVVIGPVGSVLGRTYAVIGAEVSLAARIAARSLRGQVLLSENTWRVAKAFILAGEPELLQVRERELPVRFYELLGTMRPRALSVPRRELRKSPRVPVQMSCDFQCVDNATVLAPLHCGQVLDMGYDGLCMVSPVPLDTCAEIKIALSLQLLGKRTSDIYARVVKMATDLPGYRCSIEFTGIDRPGRQAIKQFVDSQVCRL